MKLSVVIPAHDEAESIGLTLKSLTAELQRHAIDYEVVVVDDASADGTADVVAAISALRRLPASATRCEPASTSTPETRWPS
jgi:glycosyltransferase involved in cell wall biosynthesis